MFRALTLAVVIAGSLSAVASAKTISVKCELLPGGLSVNINRTELTIDTDRKSVRVLEHSTLDSRVRDRTWTNHKTNKKVVFDESETVAVSPDRIRWGETARLSNAYILNEKIMTIFDGAAKYQCKDAE